MNATTSPEIVPLRDRRLDVRRHQYRQRNDDDGDGYLEQCGVGVSEHDHADRHSDHPRDGPRKNATFRQLGAVLVNDQHEQRDRDRVEDDDHGLRVEYEQQQRDCGHPDTEAHRRQHGGADEHGDRGDEGFYRGWHLGDALPPGSGPALARFVSMVRRGRIGCRCSVRCRRLLGR